MTSLTFLGAAGTVTGSRHLLSVGDRRLLVDCGLFQGSKDLREINWEPFPIEPASIDAVVLTHAHLDHSGYLPRLVREGFRGPIYATAATRDVAGIILRDSARIQENDADYANRKGFSRHKPALPLYGVPDAERALAAFKSVPFGTGAPIEGGATLTFRRAGHILGAATADIAAAGIRTVFSGDLGRYGDPMMLDPEPVTEADHVVVEATYGNRTHDKGDPTDFLGTEIERTVARGGTVLIPAFAIGRAQSLLYHLWKLKRAGRLTTVPVFVDSPMATDAGELLCAHLDDHRLTPEECRDACAIATYTRAVEASKAVSTSPFPKVVISASGMATGGRVLHHLKSFAPDRRNTILFSGFQAAGTRGRAILEGASEVRIHGNLVPVRAQIAYLPMLSAHADAGELVRWLRGFKRPPKRAFIVHGEPTALEALRISVETDLGWRADIPRLGQRFEL